MTDDNADEEPITAYRAVCEACSPEDTDADVWRDTQIRPNKSMARSDVQRHDEKKHQASDGATIEEVAAVRRPGGLLREVDLDE